MRKRKTGRVLIVRSPAALEIGKLAGWLAFEGVPRRSIHVDRSRGQWGLYVAKHLEKRAKEALRRAVAANPGKKRKRAASRRTTKGRKQGARRNARKRRGGARRNLWDVPELTVAERRLGDMLPQRITSYHRQSRREFDINIKGSHNGYTFDAWLPLFSIRELVRWTMPKVARMTDHPKMVMEGDWSGIRDSSKEKIWRIFHKLVRPGIRGGS